MKRLKNIKGALVALVLASAIVFGTAAAVSPSFTQRITKMNSRVAIANGLVPITKYRVQPASDGFPASEHFTCNVPPGGGGWLLVSMRPATSGGAVQYFGPFHAPSVVGGGRPIAEPGEFPVQYFLLQVE